MEKGDFKLLKVFILTPPLIVFTQAGQIFAKPEVETESGIHCQN